MAADEGLFQLDPSAGGRARAQKLSREQRSEISRIAAEARWARQREEQGSPSIRRAAYSGALLIGDTRIECAVLDDGQTRVLSQGTVLQALGRAPSMGRRGDESAKRAPFLSASNLDDLITPELLDLLEPITYKLPGNRFPSVGYRAEALPLICDVWLAARVKYGTKLPAKQRATVEAAELLMRSLAKVGIIALVDEATGFQAVRAQDELQQLIRAYVREEFRKWTLVFPQTFFQEIYRLYGWQYKEGQNKHPQYVGKFINTYIYEMLPDGVLEELQRVNPRMASGNRSRKHHQHLTVDTGNEHLDRQILTVTTLLQVSTDLDNFKELFERRFPPTGKKALRVSITPDDQVTTLFEIEDFES